MFVCSAMSKEHGRVLRARPSLDADEVRRCESEAASREISSQSLMDGSWLLAVARENLELCKSMAPSRSSWGSATLTWGSMCSGSEGPAWVIAALNQLFEEHDASFRLEHVFSCEKDVEKRKWVHASSVLAEPAIAKVLARESGGSDLPALDWQSALKAHDAPCIFTDIQDMGAAQAECWEHGPGCCHVKGVDLLIVGTSCKDMSRANPGQVRQELVLNSKESKGGSAQTFNGLLSYVEQHRPLMILFENVDAMEDTKLSAY